MKTDTYLSLLIFAGFLISPFHLFAGEAYSFKKDKDWGATIALNPIPWNPAISLNEKIHMIGPFPWNKNALDTVYPPEKQVNLDASYTYGDTKIKWKTISTVPFGMINEKSIFKQKYVTYFYTEFYMPIAEEGVLLVALDEQMAMWLNAERLTVEKISSVDSPNSSGYFVRRKFQKGKNQFLLKIVMPPSHNKPYYFGITALTPSLISDAMKHMAFKQFLNKSFPSNKYRISGIFYRMARRIWRMSRILGGEELESKLFDFFKRPLDKEAVLFVWSKIFYEICNELDLPQEGHTPLVKQAAFHMKGDVVIKGTILNFAAELFLKAGDIERSIELFKKVHEDKTTDKDAARNIAGRRLAALKQSLRMRNVTLYEAIGIEDTVNYIRRTITDGSAEEAAEFYIKAMKENRNMIIMNKKNIAVNVIDYLRTQLQSWPENARNVIQKKLSLEAISECGKAGTEIAKIAAWDIFRGTAAASRMAATHAAILQDQGKLNRAALWNQQLKDSSPLAQYFAAYALSLALAGDHGNFKQFKKSLSDNDRKQSLTIAGEKTILGRTLDQFEKMLPEVQPGKPLFPKKSIPVWQVPLGSRDVVLATMTTPKYFHQMTAPSLAPATNGKYVFLNTGLSLQGYDIKMGKRVWRTPGEHKIGREAFELDGRENRVAVVRLGTHLYKGLVIYRMASILSSGKSDRIWRGGVLYAVDAGSGKVVWSTVSNPVLQNEMITSEPLFAHDMIIVTTANTSGSAGVHTVALSPRTGEVLWKSILATGFSVLGNDFVIRELPRPVLTPDGIIVVSHLGVVVQLDPLTGRIKWLRRYPRSENDYSRYHVNIPVAAEGMVVAAPRDSAFAFALDTRTGEKRWQFWMRSTPVLAGIQNDTVIFFGNKKIMTVDRGTGKIKETAKFTLKGNLPLPYLEGDRLWITTQRAIQAVDLKTLAVVKLTHDTDKRPVRMVPDGNYLFNIDPNNIRLTVNVNPSSLEDEPSEMRTDQKNSVVQKNRQLKGKQKIISPLKGNIQPRLLWHSTAVLKHRLFPKIYSGIFLSWNRYELRMHHLEGFAEILWKYLPDTPILNLNWQGDTLLLFMGDKHFGYYLEALNPYTGEILWRNLCGSVTRRVSWQNGKVYYLGVKNTTLVSADAATGKLDWEVPLGAGFGLIHINNSGQQPYISLAKNKQYHLFQIDAQTGKLTPTRLIQKGSSQSCILITGHIAVMVSPFHPRTRIVTGVDIRNNKTIWKIPMYKYHKIKKIVERDSKKILLELYDRKFSSVVDPATGKKFLEVKQGSVRRFDNNYYSLHHYRHRDIYFEIAHLERTGKGQHKKIWSWSPKKNKGHVLGTTIFQKTLQVVSNVAASHIVLTELDLKSGAIVQGPTIIKLPEVKKLFWKYQNNYLFVNCKNGLYCFQLAGKSEDHAGWLKGRVKLAEEFSAVPKKKQARGLVKMAGVLLGDQNLKWQSADSPLTLNVDRFWMPANHPSEGISLEQWNGENNISAVISISKTDKTIITVSVRDDIWIPFNGKNLGDHIYVNVGALRLTLGADESGQVIAIHHSKRYWKNYLKRVSCRLENSRWIFEIECLNKILGLQEGNTKGVFRISDDDGPGPRGQMEWGNLIGNGHILIKK